MGYDNQKSVWVIGYGRVIGYQYEIPANRLGKLKNLCVIKEYGLYGVWVISESTVFVYGIPLAWTNLKIWVRPIGYAGAVEKAVQLIRRLNATGGISLSLFCIRGNRTTATTQNKYRLFYEVLGKKEVRIALAVTHLEREADMEDWWQRNGKTLERYSVGWTCIYHDAGRSSQVCRVEGYPSGSSFAL
jgi:hypothetical protein